MKKATTAWTFAIASAISLWLAAPGRGAAAPVDPDEGAPIRIYKIVLESGGVPVDSRSEPYRMLLGIREGEYFSRQKVRESIDNLYRTESFDGIEVKLERHSDSSVTLHYLLSLKKRIASLHFPVLRGISSKDLKKSVLSLKKGGVIEEWEAEKATQELKSFLISRGYAQPTVTYSILPVREGKWVNVRWTVLPGERIRIRRIVLKSDDPGMERYLNPLLRGLNHYVPAQIQGIVSRMQQVLQKHNYFFPDIRFEPQPQKDPGQVDLKIEVACGYQYIFKFMGIPAKMDLIRSVWEKKVFEKWAEEESRARIINSLKNSGYTRAQVQSEIIVKGNVKYVIFSVVRGRRYRLGKVLFQGNHQVPEAKLKEIVQIDDLLFEKVFWLRQNSLLADLELLRLYYYYQGYTDAKVDVDPDFHRADTDILFRIQEKQQYTIDAIRFTGNQAFGEEALQGKMKSKPGGPYVPRQVNEDIYRLQNFYLSEGFGEVKIGYEISGSNPKRLEIKIAEGTQQRMGEFTIFGGSQTQRSLIHSLFALKKGEAFSQERIDQFRSELENSALFSEVRVEVLNPSPGVSDIFVKVIPDRSRFYGLGVGWEERKELGLRGTLEYQEKNIFNSISNFSAMAQLTVTGYNLKVDPLDSRGILAFDTPFFFKNNVHSTFNAWEENELFPSYRFTRYGVGASFIRYFTDKVFAVGSLKWYRTKLSELKIEPFGVDQTKDWFDTTAFTFSFARENRDDPFNPSSGNFLSADLKIGLPIFEKDYTFLKFFWNYQYHRSFLKNGVFSLSFRNGFGFGDMSITERFFAGGSHSFRGTRNDLLGPLYIDPTTQEAWPKGGNVLVLLNLEATFPILLAPIKSLYYSVFADIGNVFDKSSHLDFGELEKAIGIGLKYRTPLGPIRFDVAWNLSPLAKPRILFHLGIGNVY